MQIIKASYVIIGKNSLKISAWIRRFGNFGVKIIDYKQSSEIWLVVDDMQLNTVELWTLWNSWPLLCLHCVSDHKEYCGTVNVMKLVTSPLPSLCVWPQGILWNCERSATECCGSVNGVQLNTVELWTLWNSWPLLCLHCVSDHKESVTVRFSFCHWTPCVFLSSTELSTKPRKKRNHFRPSLLYWSRPYGVRVVQ